MAMETVHLVQSYIAGKGKGLNAEPVVHYRVIPVHRVLAHHYDISRLRSMNQRSFRHGQIHTVVHLFHMEDRVHPFPKTRGDPSIRVDRPSLRPCAGR